MSLFLGLRTRTTTAVTAVTAATLLGLGVAGAAQALDSPETSAQSAAVKTVHTTDKTAKSVTSTKTVKIAKKDAKPAKKALYKGKTTASYFWDDSSGRAGDTGLPASGKPMQKGMAASPSWPLGTEGYVTYEGKKAEFFVGDRGPGEPSDRGIMLDLDAKSFADLTGGKFNKDTLAVNGNGGKGHIKIEYVITKWGEGPGKTGAPAPFSTKAYND